MPGRKYNAGSGYRYGFNGQEKSDEIAEGLTTAQFWEYDSRIGRRWNVDPKLKVSESSYLCFSGNPILLSDLNGDQASTGDPTPVYHRTSSDKAANILKNGFDPSKSNRNGFTFFSTTPAGGSIGSAAANSNSVINASIDLSEAKTISKSQMTEWFNDGLNSANKELNTKYGSIAEVPNALKSKYQAIADGVRNTKLADFMKADGGAIYNIAGKNTVAVSEGAISSVKIEGVSGPGAATVIKSSGLNFRASTGTIGTVFILLAIAQSTYTVANSPTPVKEAITETVGLGGAIYGATTGGAAWSCFGPWGGAAGTVVGGGLGFFIGKTGSTAIMNAGSIMSNAEQKYRKQAKDEGCSACNLDH